jgi:uncharacterized membrane protein
MDAASYPDPMTFPYAPVVGMGLQQIQVWSAPFPPPKAVSEYEQMLPGSWDRFLTMAEQSQAAQILTMRNAQEYCRRDTKRGHWLGASALFAAMGCAVYCVATRQPWVAAAFLSVTVMAAARSLIQTAQNVKHANGRETGGRKT